MPVKIQPVHVSTASLMDEVPTDGLKAFLQHAAASEEQKEVIEEIADELDLDDEDGMDEAEAMLTVLEAFLRLFPAPTTKQINSLADAFELEAEAREDFILAVVTGLTGPDEDEDEEGEDDEEDDDEDDDASEATTVEEDTDSDDKLDEKTEASLCASIARLETAQTDILHGQGMLNDALNHDGAPMSESLNRDDEALKDDGEPILDDFKPHVADDVPEGARDGEPMNPNS